MEQTIANVGTADDTKLVAEVSELTAKVNAVAINTQEDYEAAVAVTRDIKARANAIKDFFKPLKDAAHLAHKRICDRENEVIKPLNAAETVLKGKMYSWVQEQERIRREKEAEERRKAQEEADRLAAEAAKREAEARALAEANRTEEAQAKQLEAEMTLQTATMVEDAGKNVVVESAAKKVDGVSYVTDYEIVVTDATKVPCEVAGVVIRPIDTMAIKRLAKMSKGAVKIDGIEIRETKSVRIGR